MSELTPEEEAEVRGLLAALPDPELPADVQARITSAVASGTEPAEQPATGPKHSGTAGSPTVLASRPPRRRRTVLLETAAVVVVLATIAAIVVGFVNRDDDTPPSHAELAHSQPTAGPITASGVDYTPTTIDTRVRELISGAAWAGPTANPTSGEDPAAGGTASSKGTTATTQTFTSAGAGAIGKLVGDAKTRQACIDQLASVPGANAVAIDVGSWKGKPAAVIVLPDENDADKVDAWVVGPTCSDADDPFPYRYQRVTRP